MPNEVGHVTFGSTVEPVAGTDLAIRVPAPAGIGDAKSSGDGDGNVNGLGDDAGVGLAPAVGTSELADGVGDAEALAELADSDAEGLAPGEAPWLGPEHPPIRGTVNSATMRVRSRKLALSPWRRHLSPISVWPGSSCTGLL